MSKKWFLGVAPLAALPAFATDMNPHKVLKVGVSKKGYTRLTVTGDVIQDVFARPVVYKDNLELHTTGHVLIVGEGLKEPVYLTVFTRKGLPQDLILLPQDQEPTPIILQKTEKKESEPRREERFAAVLKSVARGYIPEGYTLEASTLSEHQFQEQPLTLVKRYTDGVFSVLVYELSNKTEGRLTLEGGEISKRGDLAIFWEQRVLEPGEHTQILIMKERTH